LGICEPVAEAQRLASAVQHEARAEPLAELASKQFEAAKILGANCLRGLDLDPDDFAGSVLEDSVDLILIAVSVVVQPSGCHRPGEVPCQLTQDEVLQKPASRRVADDASRCRAGYLVRVGAWLSVVPAWAAGGV